MKIKDLISHLQTLNPELELVITNSYWMSTCAIEISDIKHSDEDCSFKTDGRIVPMQEKSYLNGEWSSKECYLIKT